MTISFNGLGNEGRLGNQIFQYAFIRGLAAKTGYDWKIPPDGDNRYDNYGIFEISNLFKFTINLLTLFSFQYII